MIKKTVCYDSSPALHIAEARVIELSSGTSLAQFLMVSLTFEAFLFIMLALYAMAWRRDLLGCDVVCKGCIACHSLER